MILQALSHMFSSEHRDRGTVLGGVTALLGPAGANALSSPALQHAIQAKAGEVLAGAMTPENLKIAGIAALVIGIARMAQPRQAAPLPEPASTRPTGS